MLNTMANKFKISKINFGCRLAVVLMLMLISVFSANAQKSGLIYQTAGTGASVLDPDG
jgi:hypothetical protein